jgi:hypothetical protein
MAPLPTTDSFFARWRTWGLASFATIIVPWQDKLTSIGLVSDFFQPGLNIAASIIGPLVCLTSFAALSTSSRARQQKSCIAFFIAFVVLLISCLALRYGIGLIWFPEGGAQMAVWVVWWIIYLGIFASFGVVIVSATLATPAVPQKQSEHGGNASPKNGNADIGGK